MEIACPGIILSHLPTVVEHRILNQPPFHLNHQIIFRDSRFPYRESNSVVIGMNKKRDMEIACPGIILSLLPTFVEHRILNLPPSHLNHQIIFRDSRFPYRETKSVVIGMNKIRDMEIACPGIILFHQPTVIECGICHYLIQTIKSYFGTRDFHIAKQTMLLQE